MVVDHTEDGGVLEAGDGLAGLVVVGEDDELRLSALGGGFDLSLIHISGRSYRHANRNTAEQRHNLGDNVQRHHRMCDAHNQREHEEHRLLRQMCIRDRPP